MTSFLSIRYSPAAGWLNGPPVLVGFSRWNTVQESAIKVECIIAKPVVFILAEAGWLCGISRPLMHFSGEELLQRWLPLTHRHDIEQRRVAARAVGTTIVNLTTKLLAIILFAFPRSDSTAEI